MPTGKQWVLFVNDKPKSWQRVCEQGLVVNKKDTILFRFQEPPTIEDSELPARNLSLANLQTLGIQKLKTLRLFQKESTTSNKVDQPKRRSTINVA